MEMELRAQYYRITRRYLPWLSNNGYTSCQIVAKTSYKGSVWPYRWIRAKRSGACYVIFEKNDVERRRKRLCPLAELKAVLHKVPAASKIVEIIPFKPKVLVALEEASGFMNLWEIERSCELPSRSELESALIQLLESLEAINWVHGDIRPWNIFFDPKGRIFIFIDWWESKTKNPENAEKDRQDVRNILSLFDGNATLEDLWGHPYFTMTWSPNWVRRGRVPKGILRFNPAFNL